MGIPEREKDIYKDTPLRLLGYANEVGEALRGFIGAKLVRVSYGIATIYVIADTMDKGVKTFRHNSNKPRRIIKTLFITTDTLIWQMLASVIIPGFTINRVCAFTNYLLLKNAKLLPNNRRIIVTATGLSVIPFIIKPIDKLTDILLDNTFRQLAP